MIGYAGQRTYEWADGRQLERRREALVVTHDESLASDGDGNGDLDGKAEAAKAAEAERLKETFMEKFMSLRWTGLHRMSEGEYADMLEERVLRLEAEVAVVEEAIDRLRREGAEEERTGKQGAAGETEERKALEQGSWPSVRRR